MSNLSHLPYGKTLDYWYEKLKGFRNRKLFLFTKAIEGIIFYIKKPPHKKLGKPKTFVKILSNKISEYPPLSIVIPAYLKHKEDIFKIESLLTSVKSQYRKADYVIIIDNNSQINYDYPNDYIVRRLNKNFGPARAINVGKEIAKTLNCEIIAFTDIDCILDAGWTQSIINAFRENPNANIISGRTISAEKSWFGNYHNINGTLNGRRFSGDNFLLYGVTANLAITSFVNTNLNFNEAFPNAAAEDVEFCFRANDKGFKIIYADSMLVQHNYGYKQNPFKNLFLFISLFLKFAKGQQLLLKVIPEFYDYYSNTTEISEFLPDK